MCAICIDKLACFSLVNLPFVTGICLNSKFKVAGEKKNVSSSTLCDLVRDNTLKQC